MNKKALAIVLSVLFHSAAFSQWQLVWSDEFNYKGLPDSTKWSYEEGGHGWGNRELEYYTKGELANAGVKDGNLYITARKEQHESNGFTSARLVTKGGVR